MFDAMPRRLLFSLFFAGLLCAQSGNPLDTLREDHPRLILLDQDLDRVRISIRDHQLAGEIHGRLRHRAEELLGEPPVVFEIVGPRLLTQSRRCLDRVYLLALLYRLDGDRRYLERALKELRAAADFPHWNPSHFLDTAEMSHAFAIGYDWLYPALSQADRAWIRQALVDKGLQVARTAYLAIETPDRHQQVPSRERAWWARADHNWNQVCNGGIGLGALAVADEEPELSRMLLERALASLPRAMASYRPDGGWSEGPGYWHYATRYNVYFLAGLETALGTDFGLSESEGFSRAGHFRVCFSSPAGLTFNYADSGSRVGTAAEMFWLARRFAEPVYAWHEQMVARRERSSDVLDLVWFQPEARAPDTAGWPLDAFYKGVNVAFLRGSWTDPDGIFLAVKGGDNKANHSHLDLGSFVLDAGGIRWALDLGGDYYNLPGYFGDLRWTYYRLRTESHNTLLLDGANQAPSAAAPVTEFRSAPELALARIDLSAAYPDRVDQWTRAVALAARKQVIVQDTVRANRPVEVIWGMVTGARIEHSGRRATLRQGDWLLEARIVAPEAARFDTVSTRAPDPQDPNEGTSKLVVRLPESVRETEVIVTLTPHRAGEPPPVVAVKLPL